MVLHIGALEEMSNNFKWCRNCFQIFRVLLTIGHKVYCDKEQGNFVVTRAGWEDDKHKLDSISHQLSNGDWIQYTIFCMLADQ